MRFNSLRPLAIATALFCVACAHSPATTQSAAAPVIVQDQSESNVQARVEKLNALLVMRNYEGVLEGAGDAGAGGSGWGRRSS